MLLKVVAYITRESEQGRRLLVFRHPRHWKNPIQVPQGTIEDGEDIIEGLWRELLEETGRSDCVLSRQSAKVPSYADWRDEHQERNVFHLAPPANIPETWSHIVTDGTSDKGLNFEFFWMPVSEAQQILHPSQSQWLDLL